MNDLKKKIIAEGIATFIMVFLGTGSIVINQEFNGIITHPGIAVTFGVSVTLMIYLFGKISGAHMNPAVTIALAVNREFPLKFFPHYLLGQSAGAILASLSLSFIFPRNKLLGGTYPSGSALESFALEFFLSMLLMMAILSLTKATGIIKSFTGLIIGMVIWLEALFAGPVCGASMNPVRSLGPALVSKEFKIGRAHV